MRRPGIILTGLLVFGLALWTGGPAMGGDYHTGGSLFCTDCHIMHGSQSHGYRPNGTGSFEPIGSGSPYDYLLRNEINDLCLTCHDGGTFEPDVLELTSATIVRQAGALNRLGTAPYYKSTGHTLDSTDTPPGGTWTPDAVLGLVCTDCHDQHGWGGPLGTNAYRNLAPFPGDVFIDPPDYTTSATDKTKDVLIDFPGGYDVGNVEFNEPNPTDSKYAEWCGGCHTDFYSGTAGTHGGVFARHPIAGVDIGAVGNGHSSAEVFAYGPDEDPTTAKLNYVKVMTSTGNWTPNDSALVTDHTPSCMTCHKAHGNQRSFGAIYMNAFDTGGITEEGTKVGDYENLCQQCHVQGT